MVECEGRKNIWNKREEKKQEDIIFKKQTKYISAQVRTLLPLKKRVYYC